MKTPSPIEALITLGEALQRAVHVGNAAPVVQRLFAWIHAAPQPGDLILETSTSFRGPSPDRIGAFVRREERPVCNHEREDVNLERCPECSDADRRVDRFTWLQQLELAEDGRAHLHRWYNAGFIRLPATAEQLEEATTVPDDPGGTSYDRERLVAVIADAGFELRGIR